MGKIVRKSPSPDFTENYTLSSSPAYLYSHITWYLKNNINWENNDRSR